MRFSGTLDVKTQSAVNRRWRNKSLKHCVLFECRNQSDLTCVSTTLITRGFERWWYSNFELGLLIGSLPLGHRTTNSREEADWNLMGLHWRQFPRCMLTHVIDCPVDNKQETVCVCVFCVKITYVFTYPVLARLGTRGSYALHFLPFLGSLFENRTAVSSRWH